MPALETAQEEDSNSQVRQAAKYALARLHRQ
jgi:hypothetical protein